MSEFGKEVKIDIKVDEKDALGHFANFSNAFHSPEEFILDFLFVNPTPPPGFGKLVSGARQGNWKRVTVKEGFVNTLITLEVLCWFFVGEVIGKRHLRGYDV